MAEIRKCNEGYVSCAQTLRLDSSNGSFATVAKLALGAQTLRLFNPHFTEKCYQDSAIRSRDTSFITLSFS